ncbi:ribulose-phosphate 3-epimerase [Mycoplasmoides pneumoniae]|uniref:Ribulose-phosphate 3-epimerase n=2 Tax=Mycoplasmoides pneumoniae TaxID=2104 RepID=RPE_MYCPN|nr:ribulose-phosphate 3-epimerase [Mycoplasmoides pneumoniae]P75522.1 RecName: Full=Ribulose-phosphate 3-epimerase [Mycoplasmoides pneumoniae M129]AAB96229.1 D-ribulose-5-phosphate 3 epimerase [Mycoplasmoides pneumoniae M129]AGC04176.2 ribulose-phosphate 3-epimerase [Mycoplasmoides pneumoniae M129-B7]ALA30134.1 ribulose-phosphate 3-epimerase [Mycoplasmoides pneumoniae PI 1428]ALA31087.1 ribulose-phosphate 3-epimerase [Mycoplasmoides pneumoniae 19294]ALA31531.1 ribulose phosphate epimerase [My
MLNLVVNREIAFSLLPLLHQFDRKLLEQFFADGLRLIHYDVMDHFVDNTVFQGEHLDELQQIGFQVNVHLMVQALEQILPVYLHHQAVKRISFHVEPFDIPTIKHFIAQIKQAGKQVGLAFKFTTPLVNYERLVQQLDFVTLMSVPPGKGGQAFNSAVFNNLKQAHKYHCSIEIDGGIKLDNIHQIQDDVNFIVMGSGFIKLERWQRQQLLKTNQ